jgi:hypothetical protein
MSRPADRDVVLDALALIECAHRDDFTGAVVLIDNCDLRAVVMFTSRVAADLVEHLADEPDEILAWLREHHR